MFVAEETRSFLSLEVDAVVLHHPVKYGDTSEASASLWAHSVRQSWARLVNVFSLLPVLGLPMTTW